MLFIRSVICLLIRSSSWLFLRTVCTFFSFLISKISIRRGIVRCWRVCVSRIFFIIFIWRWICSVSILATFRFLFLVFVW